MSQTAMPEPSPLSPAANAVLNAFLAGNWESTKDRQRLATVLRAAADQVVPKLEVMPQRDLESRREAMVWGMVNQTQVTRLQLLAIADELEGN